MSEHTIWISSRAWAVFVFFMLTLSLVVATPLVIATIVSENFSDFDSVSGIILQITLSVLFWIVVFQPYIIMVRSRAFRQGFSDDDKNLAWSGSMGDSAFYVFWIFATLVVCGLFVRALSKFLLIESDINQFVYCIISAFLLIDYLVFFSRDSKSGHKT